MGQKAGKAGSGPTLQEDLDESAFGGKKDSGEVEPSAPPLEGPIRVKSGTLGPPVLVKDATYFHNHQNLGMENFHKMPTIDGCPAICQKDRNGTSLPKGL